MPATPTSLQVTTLAERVARQDERIGRLEATLRALARLPEEAHHAPASADTKPAHAGPTPNVVPWPAARTPPPASEPVPHGFVTLGRAAAGVAHDLTNLLSAVRGYADLLAEHVPATDPRRVYVDGLTGAVEVAAGVTRQLVSLTQPAATLPPQTDVAAALGRVERVARGMLGATVRLTVAAAAGLPPVRATEPELAQVVLNLCLNARDAMPDGGALTVAAAHADGGVTLTVRDTGAGMDAATRARLFEPGFTTKGGDGGHGLGLMAVRDIAARAGGRVDVESAPGAGTTVRVRLPSA